MINCIPNCIPLSQLYTSQSENLEALLRLLTIRPFCDDNITCPLGLIWPDSVIAIDSYIRVSVFILMPGINVGLEHVDLKETQTRTIITFVTLDSNGKIT
eukprot:961336_1